MPSFARLLPVVVCFALFLTVSDARPGFTHRRRHHNNNGQSRHTRTASRVVFDGIAATSFVESHEPEEPATTTYYPVQTTTTTTSGGTGTGTTGTGTTTTTITPKVTTIVPDTCEEMTCHSHEDCTYKGCGGHFCVSCPACDGLEEQGVCLWNPTPDDLACPVLNCPSTPTHSKTFNIIDTPPQTLNITELETPSSPQNETQIEQSAEPPQDEQPVPTTQVASPWDSSFSNLKEESQNKTETETVYVEEQESNHNGTDSSGHELG